MKKLNLSLKYLFRLLLFAIGLAVSINGIVLSFTTNFNVGNVLTLCLGAFFILWSLLYETLIPRISKWLKIAISITLVILIIFVSFLLCYGVNDNITYKEDAIIVLGAGVHGETPSRVLKDRLNTAIEYYSKNTEVLIVVSGGKGPQETVTEAYAMEKYLIGKGIPNENIVKEEKSTSTYENFLYSKEMLDNLLGEDYKAAFISNEYHIYRAKGIAKNAGLKDLSSFHSNTRWYSVLPGTLRECLAVVKFWVFGK